MIAFAYYLLKVIVCSALLYSYYVLALRNKLYHQWNRFYLLAAVLLSLSLPLIEIKVFPAPKTEDSQVVKILQVVNAGDEYVAEISTLPEKHLSTEQIVTFIYLFICAAFLFMLLRTFLHIRRLIQQNPLQYFDEFKFVNTEAKGTPFSFFNYIFWNRNIEPDSATGQQIMKHELAHVKEKHTHDKVFMNITMIFFWMNPFFWLIRKEMAMIHEFIADQKSVEQGDTRAFAAMILQSFYPKQQFSITNNFFYSPLKRRLLMLTKLNNPKTNYISRLLVLPLLSLLIFAFTLKVNNDKRQPYFAATLDQPFIVIVNPAHGGTDNGAIGANGELEKDIALAISKKIRAVNNNPNIKVVLTRENDEFQDIRSIVDSATNKSPGAFVSIHMNAPTPESNTSNPSTGFEIFISDRKKSLESQNVLLGSILTEELRKTYAIESNLKKRKSQGIWVLDAPTVNYPAVLIECGYITNQKDLAFVKDEKNQEKIARNILDGIERYIASSKNKVKISGNFASPGNSPDTSIETLMQENKRRAAEFLKVEVSDIKSLNFQGEGENIRAIVKLKDKTTREISVADVKRIGMRVPPPPPPPPAPPAPPTALKMPDGIKSIDATEDGHVVIIYDNNNAEKITRQEAIDRNLYPFAKGASIKGWKFKDKNAAEPLVILDGKNLGKRAVASLNELNVEPENIQEITVLKNEDAVARYGEDARNGVVIITSKSGAVKDNDPIFYQPEIQPEFPGGASAFAKFIGEKLKARENDLRNDAKSSGVCEIQFKVDTFGNLSDFKALSLPDSKLAQILIEAISGGPKWKPAIQNGRTVKAFHIVSYSFAVNQKN